MNQNRENMKKAIQEQIAMLKEEAEAMTAAHRDYRKTENNKREKGDRSILEVVIKKQKNAFGIEWNRIERWIQKKNNSWLPIKRYIPRGANNFHVNLKKYSKPWEQDELKIFEDRAAEIRKELDIYNKFVAALKRMDKNEED